jgi:anti-sigma regulatory factor (Ser/Thr protein kinase)/putative methionine-R-sulfoxide reductase with GAF domain
MVERTVQTPTVSENIVPASGDGDLLASLDHLRKLQSVTDAALANLGVDDLLNELLIRVREALETDTAAILLLDKSTNELVARAAKGIEEEVEQGVRIPVGRGFAGTIAATRQPVTIFDVDHSIVINPILSKKGIHSLLGVPLTVEGELVGVLHVGTLHPRHFTQEDTTLLQLVGDRIALAILAGLYERERTVSRMLQHSLLPETLPTPAGIRLAARYLPAKGGEIGGDWYDAFVLPSGALGIAIGDVVGRGLEAASAMARLRNALRAYAIESDSPGAVLARLDRLVQHLDHDEMATVLYGIVDPVGLTFRFASAGHIPPVLRQPEGSARVSGVTPSPPLGAGVGGTIEEFTERLRLGTAFVLCTDGLIERRSRSLDVGLSRLADAAKSNLPPDDLCDRIIGQLMEDQEGNDDVALVVVEMTPDDGDPWVTSVRAEPKQLAPLRRALQRWLSNRGVGPHLMYDVIAASGEAVANAIEHAYGPAGGVIRVAGERRKGELAVTVRDFGRWRPPRYPNRGRGLPMMQGFADWVEVSRSDHGTSVSLRWDLGKTA